MTILFFDTKYNLHNFIQQIVGRKRVAPAISGTDKITDTYGRFLGKYGFIAQRRGMFGNPGPDIIAEQIMGFEVSLVAHSGHPLYPVTEIEIGDIFPPAEVDEVQDALVAQSQLLHDFVKRHDRGKNS